MNKNILILRNVRMNGELHDLTIDEDAGIMTAIGQTNEKALPTARIRTEDACGLHYMPAMTDKHIHLDKHFLGEPWKPLQPFVTLPGQLAFEKAMLTSLPTNALERARRMLLLLLSQGTTSIRTHVDIDPVIGLAHLEGLLQAKSEFAGRMDIEIVAFPQQGLLRSGSIPILKEAMRAGADYVGGVDPAGLDQRVDASLEAMFEVATEFGAGVDMHLHDPGHLGLYTIGRFADLAEEAGLAGRAAVSHAYCLGQINEAKQDRIADKLRASGVAIITSVPIDRPMPPVGRLLDASVDVFVGCDNILDAWSPFGNGDLLARGSRLAEKEGWIVDEDLLRVAPLIGAAALTPKPGDAASFLLVPAMNPMHAIASAPPREAVYTRGRLVGGRWHEDRTRARSASGTEHSLS
ncbi:amidohydrolase family protein [Paenibacillus sp. LHD-117]|uniref:amidohydrolase family protein n=1 Tax=Paenibacillus sp. LHD-117 TaxID=3071412 RepID=UPI0027E00185|nr:amidohydrolase family protein [Paenibacillus sp. LHD-117]MDQ6418078.1 amidohydrolase family protein [Paenibacillus sp. LHD-117]